MANSKEPLIFHPYFPLAIVILAIILGLLHEAIHGLVAPLEEKFAEIRSDRKSAYPELARSIKESATALEGQDLSPAQGRFSLDILPLHLSYSDVEMNAMLRQKDKYSGTIIYWKSQDDGKLIYTMSASSVDGLQNLVNAYLEGYQPFPVENVMMPLYVLSQRKSYLLDRIHYFGREDVWQTSRQAYYYSRGDCEDHALILADWLIAMGEDARVVLGRWRNEGHAWVVLLRDGKEYLLEATSKSGLGRNKPYPLARLHTEYQPEYMFNDKYFWVNTGYRYTANYSDLRWEKRSRFNDLDPGRAR